MSGGTSKAWPVAGPEWQAYWLKEMGCILQSDPALAARESMNYRFLCDILHNEAVVNATPCLLSALSATRAWPRWDLHGAASSATEVKGTYDTGQVVYNWFTAPSATAAQTIVATAFDKFETTQEFKVRADTGVAYHFSWKMAMHATHLIFMVTEWLTAPHAWQTAVYVDAGQRNALLKYCEQALDVLLQVGTRGERNPRVHANAELFLELACVVGVLNASRRRNLTIEARALASSPEDDWDGIMQEEQARHTSRSGGDVKIHCYYLRAWTCRLATDAEHVLSLSLALCLSLSLSFS